MASRRSRGSQSTDGKVARRRDDSQPPADPAPSPRESRKRQKVVRDLTAELDGASDRAARAKLLESAADVFALYATPVLYEWGADYEGLPMPTDDRDNRALVLRALLGALGDKKFALPHEEAAARACWSRRSKKKKMPTLADEAEQYGLTGHEIAQFARTGAIPSRAPSSSRDEADEADASEADDDDKNTHRSGPGAPTVVSFAQSARGSTAVLCRVCHVRAAATLLPGEGFLCEACGHYGHVPRDDPLQQLRPSRASRDLAGQSQAHSSSTSASSSSVATPKLTRADAEMQRLTELGPSRPNFGENLAQSSDAALQESRTGYNAKLYHPPSLQLLRFVRSGRIADIGWAVPTLQSVTERDEDAGDAKVVFSGNKATLLGAVRAPELAAPRDLLHALGATILPALVDRPRALSGWAPLLRTVALLDGEYGWEAARTYLRARLNNAVLMLDEPFGSADHDLLAHVRSSYARIGRGGAPAQSAPAYSGGGGAQSARGGSATPAAPVHEGYCRNWNLNVPEAANCNRTHLCYWRNCTAADKNHRGSECPSRPAFGGGGGARRGGGSGGGGAQRGGRRGGGSGRGGRGGAQTAPITATA
jgi:hypothetical protein